MASFFRAVLVPRKVRELCLAVFSDIKARSNARLAYTVNC